jgi:hypothetical protein
MNRPPPVTTRKLLTPAGRPHWTFARSGGMPIALKRLDCQHARPSTPLRFWLGFRFALAGGKSHMHRIARLWLVGGWALGLSLFPPSPTAHAVVPITPSGCVAWAGDPANHPTAHPANPPVPAKSTATATPSATATITPSATATATPSPTATATPSPVQVLPAVRPTLITPSRPVVLGPTMPSVEPNTATGELTRIAKESKLPQPRSIQPTPLQVTPLARPTPLQPPASARVMPLAGPPLVPAPAPLGPPPPARPSNILEPTHPAATSAARPADRPAADRPPADRPAADRPPPQPGWPILRPLKLSLPSLFQSSPPTRPAPPASPASPAPPIQPGYPQSAVVPGPAMRPAQPGQPAVQP